MPGSKHIEKHFTAGLFVRDVVIDMRDSCQIRTAKGSDPTDRGFFLSQSQTVGGLYRIICGGVDEEFENEEKRDALLSKKTSLLEHQLAKLLPHMESTAEFAWCGSFGTNSTALPTIIEIACLNNCYMILAFGDNGIAFIRLAVEISAARIVRHLNPDECLFQ